MTFSGDTISCPQRDEIPPTTPPVKRRVRRFVTATLFGLAALTGFSGLTTAQPGVPLRDSVSSGSSDSSPTAVPAPGDRDYIAEVRSNFTPENRRYSYLRSTLGFVGVAWDVGIGLLLLFSGFSARFRDVAHGRSGNRYVRMLIYLSLFIVAVSLLSLPLNWFTGWQVEHAFGLSNESLGDWFMDEVKATLVGIVAFGVTGLVALAWAGIEKFPRAWWLWLAGGMLPVLLIATILVPVVVDPLFNKFVPLGDAQLKAQILSLAEQAGIPGRNVYEVDKSRQTKKYNAYVTGWGVSQRIVLWDTTLKGMETDEILFVMAHEMGHYRLAHIWKGVLYTTAASFLLLFLAALLMRRAVARFGGRWGFTELHDIASVPLFMVVVTLLSFVGDPVSNYASRTMEHEADTFALEVTHTNDAGARAFLKLGSQNRSNPEPPVALKVMQYSHPPLIERIRFALDYRPWEEGRPNRFYAKVSR